MVVLLRVVLHDYYAAVFHVVEDAGVVIFEIFAHGVGAHAENDGVEFGEISAGEISGAEEMNVDAEIHERLRNFIAGADDVSDVQIRGDFYIGAGGAIGGSAIEIVGTQAVIADGVITLFVFVAVVGGDGGDGVGFFG